MSKEKQAALRKKLAEYNEAKKKVTSSSQDKAKDVPKEKVAPPKVPAYQRFAHLADPEPSTLKLPFKYQILHDMFKSADTVVSMLYKRSETCTFSKLKQAVQKMTGK